LSATISACFQEQRNDQRRLEKNVAILDRKITQLMSEEVDVASMLPCTTICGILAVTDFISTECPEGGTNKHMTAFKNTS
jgi:hypothetical protein